MSYAQPIDDEKYYFDSCYRATGKRLRHKSP